MYSFKAITNFYWLIICIVILQSCQASEFYSNKKLGFSFELPNNWELSEEDKASILFQVKDEGDAGIWIRVFEEPDASTAQQSLKLETNNWIKENNLEILPDISYETLAHDDYEVAIAHFTDQVQRMHITFQADFYHIVIQTPDRMAVIFISGDGLEPAKAKDVILDSFEFLTD